MNHLAKKLLVIATTFLALAMMAVPVAATLRFHYDPLTGNVSFDTSQTRDGNLILYGLHINPHASNIRFRAENAVRISNSIFFDNDSVRLAEAFLSQPASGIYTVGDVLPVGLSEETWGSLFFDLSFSSTSSPATRRLGNHFYNDILGGGYPPPAQFIYGRPEGEFDNRIDVIDPETLSWAESATLIYQQATGQVILDTAGVNGGHIVGFELHSEENFIAEQFTPFINVPFTQADESTIGLYADLIEPGRYSLGNILESGLSSTEYEAVFNKAMFIGRAGFGSTSFDFETDGQPFALAFHAVPEPTTLTMLVLSWGVLSLAGRSKKVPGTI